MQVPKLILHNPITQTKANRTMRCCYHKSTFVNAKRSDSAITQCKSTLNPIGRIHHQNRRCLNPKSINLQSQLPIPLPIPHCNNSVPRETKQN